MTAANESGDGGGGGTSLQPFVLFSFSTKHLAKKDKVRFFYALKGRNGKQGAVQRYEVEHLGRGVLLVPAVHAAKVSEFLTFWKCAYTQKEVWLK